MVKAFIVDFQVLPRGRRRVMAVLQWGGQETLLPRDVGMQTIDSIILSNQNITTTQNTQPVPIGSVAITTSGVGSGAVVQRVRGQGPGSSITLRWTAGSSGTRVAAFHGLGTLSTGTKTAHAWIMGS